MCEEKNCHREWQVQLDVAGIGKVHLCGSCAGYYCCSGSEVRKKEKRDAMILAKRRGKGLTA